MYGIALHFRVLLCTGLQQLLQIPQGWEVFANDIATSQQTDAPLRTMTAAKLRKLVSNSSDRCLHCTMPVEEACYLTCEGQPIHCVCVICPGCKSKGFQLDAELLSTAQGLQNRRERCSFCSAPLPDNLCYRHRLDTYISRLWTAVARCAASHQLSFEEVLEFKALVPFLYAKPPPESSSDVLHSDRPNLVSVSRMIAQQQVGVG